MIVGIRGLAFGMRYSNFESSDVRNIAFEGNGFAAKTRC